MKKFKGDKMKKNISLLIFLFLSLIMLNSFCLAADVESTIDTVDSMKVGRTWSLGAVAISGNSNVMVGSGDCAEYTVFIKVSGSGTLTVAAKTNFENANWATCIADNTYTITSAGTYKYTWTAPTPFLIFAYTISGIVVDSNVIKCRTK